MLVARVCVVIEERALESNLDLPQDRHANGQVAWRFGCNVRVKRSLTSHQCLQHTRTSHVCSRRECHRPQLPVLSI